MFDFDTETGEIWIHDDIGPAWWGMIDSELVKDALRALDGKHAVVRLNTPGGSVDHGIAIFNMLREYRGGVTTIVDSLAASMGSYLLQAGERRIASTNSMVMIHDPWSIALGNSAEMRKQADILDKYAARMLPEYAERSGKTTEDVAALMAEESWYAGQEIVDAGFADEIQSPARGHTYAPVVGHQLPRFARNMPEQLKAAAKKEVKRGEKTAEKRQPTRAEFQKQIAAKTETGELPPSVIGARW